MIFNRYATTKALEDLYCFDDNALRRYINAMHLSDEKPNDVGMSPLDLFFANFTPFADSYHYEYVMRILKAQTLGYDTPAHVPAEQADILSGGLVLYWHDSSTLTQALLQWYEVNTYDALAQKIPNAYWDKKTITFYVAKRWGEPCYPRLLNSNASTDSHKFENMLLEWWNRRL